MKTSTGFRSRPRRPSLALRGLTPFIDTLFLLLFALLATSQPQSAQVLESVRIRLPQVLASPEVPPAPAKRLVIEIDAHSKVRMAGSDEALETPKALDRAIAAGLGDALPEEVAVEIRGDKDSRHGTAVRLLQQLRLRGFSAIELLATEEAAR